MVMQPTRMLRARARATAMQTASAVHQVVPQLLTQAGARRVIITAPEGKPPIRTDPWVFDSVEVVALAMNVVRGDKRHCKLGDTIWKPSKKALARALVATALEREMLLEATANSIVEQGAQRKIRRTAPAAAPPVRAESVDHQVSTVLEQLRTWTLKVHKSEDWTVMKDVLVRVQAAGPLPVPSVQRDGFKGELWACSQLQPVLPAGWSMRTGVQLDFSHLSQNGHTTVKGVKGEADVLFLDPQGTCQAVLEIKLGGTVPYRSIYSDVRKLCRMMAITSGSRVRTVPASPEGGQQGPGTPAVQEDIRFSPHCTPYYLVMRDGDPMDGQTVLVQAEAALTRINLGMALGSSSRPWRSIKLGAIDQHYTELALQQALVDKMREKTAKDFISTLQAVDVYEMPPPLGQSWAI